MPQIKERLLAKIPNLLRLSPRRRDGKLSSREKSWLDFLRDMPLEERRQMINARREFARERNKLLEQLKFAVGKARQQFPDLNGVVIIGSFAKGREHYADLDLVLVVSHYEPTQDGLDRTREMERAIHEHMPPRSGRGSRESRMSPSFAHFGNIGLINLSDHEQLNAWAGDKRYKLWDFVGDKETKNTLTKLAESNN